MKKILLAFSFLSLVYVAGFLWFVTGLPLRADVPVEETEALMVFTGGKGRLEVGFEFLSKAYGGPILVTGVHGGVSREKLLAGFGLSEGQSKNLSLDYEAHTTRENVAASIAWAKKNNLGHLGLITSYYHIPRCRLLFKNMAPQLKISVFPVYHSGVSWSYLFKEYGKFTVVALAGFFSKILVPASISH